MEHLTHSRRELIRAIFQPSQDSGGSAIALRTEQACSSLTRELASLIGIGGVASVYQRAQFLTSSAYPWISSLPNGSSSSPLADIQSTLATLSPEEATAGVSALLTLITDNLATLIGESLTAKLLRRAWPDAATNLENRK